MSATPGASLYRSWAAALVLLAMLVAGGVTPGSKLDRVVFSWVAKVIKHAPLWVEGFGTRGTPWSLRSFSEESPERAAHAPAIVWVGDDPDGVFQSSPPSPVDYAVMFSNLKRLGLKHTACAVVLAWEDPDVIGLAALEKKMEAFDSMTVAVPLARGAVAQPMPAALRRASLPLEVVKGDGLRIPAVNRVAVPDAVLGGERAWAGFSVIESEPDGGQPFVCARWDDRVVLSFAMCHAVRRMDLPLDALEIRLGECVRLGRKGPIIPIDESGRLRLQPGELAPSLDKAAEDLIDAQAGWFPPNVVEPVILADKRALADPEVRAFSARLSAEVALIASGAGLSKPKDFPRPSAVIEWLLIEAVAFALAGLLWLRARTACVLLALLVGAVAFAQFAAFSIASIWLPGAAMLIPAGITLAALCGRSLKLASSG